MSGGDSMNDASHDYEWAVMYYRYPDDPHRGPMSKDEAHQWVREWEEMAENSEARVGMFYVSRRPVGRWETA